MDRESTSDRDDMLWRTVAAYGFTAGTLIILFIVGPGTDHADYAPLAALGVGFATLGLIRLLLWTPLAMHQFKAFRTKAVSLWLYTAALAGLAKLTMDLWQSSGLVQVVMYVGTFLFMTTLAMGILPGYGGVALENWETTRREADFHHFSVMVEPWTQEPIVRVEKHGKAFGPQDQMVMTVTAPVCRTCLTVLRPDDSICWRCRTIVRHSAEAKRAMLTRRKERWEEKEVDGAMVWVRHWGFYHSLYTNRGAVPRVGVSSLWEIADHEGHWEVSVTASTIRNASEHLIRIKNGDERGPRLAKKAADRAVRALDFDRFDFVLRNR